MGEEEVVALGKHQRICEKSVAEVVVYANQPSQDAQSEALADDRSRLEGMPVGHAQSVHARQDQALDRGGNRVRAPLFDIAQKLLEEKGVAVGPLDAGEGDALRGA